MPQLSHRGHRLPESPIRKLVPYAEAAVARGIEVIKLNIGQPDIQSPKPSIEAVRRFDEPLVEYTHSAGLAELRKGFRDYYLGLRIELKEHELMVTSGGSEAIQFAFGAIADPGDEVIVPEPLYANYISFAIQAGLEVVPVTSHLSNGFALPSIETIEALVGPKTRAIVVCNPGNPTGSLYSRQELEQLRDLALRKDLFILADEVYREFVYDGARHTSILDIEGLDQHAIVVDSVSKRYSLCGVRIGMLVSRNAAVMQAALKFAQARLSPPSLGQIASLGALEADADYFTQVLNEYRHRRDILVDGLLSIPGIRCPRPKGAFYAVAELPVPDAEDFARWMLSEFEYDGATVMFAPNQGFYSTPGLGKSEIRLAYVLEGPKLKQAVEVLRHGLQSYAQRG
ncbi:aminotransferase class I/II-fold pyridoxal phosphate-dependent enzyme [bacterium]|nr:aminotransferase class I/II-fold pyridoxal phosphate-dependent enzyme [bacterium]